jgi:hypothetical protein
MYVQVCTYAYVRKRMYVQVCTYAYVRKRMYLPVCMHEYVSNCFVDTAINNHIIHNPIQHTNHTHESGLDSHATIFLTLYQLALEEEPSLEEGSRYP